MAKFLLSTICCFLSIFSFLPSAHAHNVGVCVMATGKYIHYAERMITSARKHFCKEHDVTYFVFTDQPLAQSKDCKRVEQKRLGWPNDTLMRFSVYAQHKQLFNDMDYLFAIDADMLFVDTVGSEILSNRVGTQHPGFVDKRGSYETDKKSTAYVGNHEGKYYFAGGFYGGSKHEFIHLCEQTTHNIMLDKKKDHIAVWHDESHLNRYFIDNPPTLMLSPSYCFPESWNLPYKKRLLALDKNHEEMRK